MDTLDRVVDFLESSSGLLFDRGWVTSSWGGRRLFFFNLLQIFERAEPFSIANLPSSDSEVQSDVIGLNGGGFEARLVHDIRETHIEHLLFVSVKY